MKSKDIGSLLSHGEGLNVEFKESLDKSIGKEICAFANGNGGKILLGVTDDGTIKGASISNKLKSEIQNYARNIDPQPIINISSVENILIIDVPEGKNKPYSANGRFYLRIGTNCQQLKRDEVSDLFKEEGLVRFDESFNNKFDVKNDFNHSAFKFFLEQAKISHFLKRENILKNMMLIEKGRIRNAGVLLFCRDIKNFFIQGTISCFLYRGNDKYKILDQKEFSADLYSNYQNAMTYLQSHLNTEYIIKGGPRKERLELPEEALREAILNAIAHRDYFSTSNIHVNIFKNRVVVINPGGLIGKLTVKDLYEKSIPRNPLLFDLMQRMELAEKAGSGLIRMRKAMRAYKLSVPRIKADKHWFSIYFIRPEMERIIEHKPLPARVAVEGLNEGLNEGLKTLLSAIK